MKTPVIRSGLFGVLLLLFSAGCASIVFPLQQEKSTDAADAGQERIALSSEALAQYSMGLLEFADGQSDKALVHYEAAVRNDPDNPMLRLELAVAYFHQNRLPDMYAMLDEVLRRDPNTMRARQLKALALRMEGKHQEALVPLRAAAAIEPTEASHYLEIASIHARARDIDAALDVLEKALPRVQDRLSLFQAIGELYLSQAASLRSENRAPVLPKTPLAMMENALEEFPEDPYLLTQYGDLLILHRNIADAIDIFSRIEALNPDDLMIRQKLALNLAAVGDKDKAIELLEDLSQRPPVKPSVLLYLAELYEQNEQPDQALATLNRILEKNPELSVAYVKQAFLLIQLRRADEAFILLNKGHAALPDDLPILEMLGYVHSAMTNHTEAVACLGEVEANLRTSGKKPLMSNFYLNYAISLQQLDRIDEAAGQIRQALTEQPDALNDYLAIVLRSPDRRDKLQRALQVLELLTDVVPDTATSHTMYGLIAFQSEAYDIALDQFERAEQNLLREESDEDLTAQFYFWLGASAERIKQFEKSETYFLRAIQLEPDHAESHNYLAYMLAERGEKLDMAYDHIGVALAIDPENAAYLDTRGWIYFKQGKYEPALADIQAALVLLPDDPTITDHLGDIYQALGNETEARTWWQKSLDLDPDNQAVRTKLGLDSETAQPDTEADTTR
jgi:tetratricopeptide (TPR) repeat protein